MDKQEEVVTVKENTTQTFLAEVKGALASVLRVGTVTGRQGTPGGARDEKLENWAGVQTDSARDSGIMGTREAARRLLKERDEEFKRSG